MANLLTVEHASPGQHVELNTLNGPVRAVAMQVGMRTERTVLAMVVAEGSHVELKTTGGTLPAVTVPSGAAHLTLLASSGLGHLQTVQLETPMGTLAVVGWDETIGDEPQGDEGEPFAGRPLHATENEPELQRVEGDDMPPPTRP